MPYAPSDGARIWYEEAGTGLPILFIHEFGADHREWEDQVRFFSREYCCITYAARGYTPSDVPTDPKLYGQDFAVKDAVAVLRHLGIPKAHVVGLSMGGFAAILFGLRHPEMAISLVPGSYVADVDLHRRRLLLHVLDTERQEQVDAEKQMALRIDALVIRALGSKQDVRELSDPVPEVTR